MNTFIGKSVHFDDKYHHIELTDGRIISTPMVWYHELRQAYFQQLLNYQFICRGTGVEWPKLDYHLNIESMMVAKLQQQAA